jgi:glycerol-3-phosphate acyltransferase PlsY
MTAPLLERVAGACVVFGATLLAAYGVLFVLLLPIGQGPFDYSRLVLNPYWRPLALIALVGIISFLAGVDAIYSRLQGSAGVAGTIGLLLTKVALVLQACMITWELLLDPIISARLWRPPISRPGSVASSSPG